jgi:hypothetical protein
MTIRDLLENASLDALGLLDEEERAEFESAFRSAAPEVQAQVRREQRRAADLDATLPNVEAPVGLRARVVGAVRRAIAEVSTPVGSVHPEVDSGHRRAGFLFLRTTPVWRAACIGFATATVVLAGAFGWMTRAHSQLASQMTSGQMLEEFQQVAGARALDILAARNRDDVSLIPADHDVAQGVIANLYLDIDKGEAVLLCRGLPALAGSYRLVVEDGTNQKRIEEFKSTSGGTIPVMVKGLSAEDLRSLAIVGPDADGGPDRTILRATGA